MDWLMKLEAMRAIGGVLDIGYNDKTFVPVWYVRLRGIYGGGLFTGFCASGHTAEAAVILAWSRIENLPAGYTIETSDDPAREVRWAGWGWKECTHV